MKTSKNLLYFFLFFSITFSTISCNRGPVYEKYLKMKDSTWDRFSMKLYEIPIEEAGKSYDITLSVRTLAQFQYDDLPVYVILTTPSGEERMREVTVPIRENGTMIGVPKEKVYETSVILWKNINIADKGKCKISIENIIPKIQTEGVDALGIVVTKAK
ncbi:MAG: hypothetical protein WCI92_02510 [Bacteroidota bacterium]